MNILFCGDVVGRSGREAIKTHIPRLKEELALDFIVVNGENAAGGFGITPSICQEFYEVGVDVITCGDHVWDQKELLPQLEQDKRILRPHNFPTTTPGTGIGEYTTDNGKKIVVLHLLGQIFMKDFLDSPFTCAEKALEPYILGSNVDAIIVDTHAEATSEKTAMGHFLDGKVSLISGSHTHIPTADIHILPGGTGYQTDAGMCGDYNSVIGFKPETPLQGFVGKRRKDRMETASGEATLCGIYAKIDDNGKATALKQIKVGGRLAG